MKTNVYFLKINICRVNQNYGTFDFITILIQFLSMYYKIIILVHIDIKKKLTNLVESLVVLVQLNIKPNL